MSEEEVPDQKFECIGKGGEYTVVAAALGAGTLKQHECMFVYKNEAGIHFVRTHDDFWRRMKEIGPELTPAFEMHFDRPSEPVAWRRFDGEGNFDYWDDEDSAGGSVCFPVQPLFTGPDAAGRTFDDGIACAFDTLKFAACNTEDDARIDVLEEMAGDIIENSPTYRKSWLDITALAAENANLKREVAALNAARASLVAEFDSKKLRISDDDPDWTLSECWNNGITQCQCIVDPSLIKPLNPA